jgi:hypothetical protein
VRRAAYSTKKRLEICRHEPRADRRKCPLRSVDPPSTASNGRISSANCSLKANQSAKSVHSPISRISHKCIGGWKRTTTFATNTRAREEQADHYFQEIIDIADNATPETVNVARLRAIKQIEGQAAHASIQNNSGVAKDLPCGRW